MTIDQESPVASDGYGTGSFLLSAYLSPPKERAFTTHRHDQCVALWQRGDDGIRLIRYWELERLTGQKHHEMPLYEHHGPDDVIDRLLETEGIKRAKVERIWGTPGVTGFEAIPEFDRRDLPLHSLSHLFSGLGMDSDAFRDSGIVALALDGGPDYTLEDRPIGNEWYAGATSVRGRVEFHPVESPGLLWQSAQRHFGLEPGTLMALAHATSATVDVDPAVLLEEEYWGGYALLNRCFDRVGALIEQARRHLGGLAATVPEGFSEDELVASAVVKVIQSASMEIVARGIDSLLRRMDGPPQDTHLSISGGYALNCPTNSEMMRRYGFRSLLTPPCANDAGQALGLGLLGFFANGELGTRPVRTGLPYVGEKRLRLAAARQRWRHRILRESPFEDSVFVADLRAQPVAWVNGAAEIGPRALGHRSLLGDPTQERTKQILNDVKQRQWWRPVAPIVLEEHAAQWFEGGRRSPFMLETFQLAEGRRDRIPAVAHLDGSARIQTLSEHDDPFLHRALSAFHQVTGVPVVCNTSLNDRGEPIADSAADAINFCVRKGIRVAYIDGRRLELDTRAPVTEVDGPEPRPLRELYAAQSSRPEEIFGQDVDAELLLLLYLWPGLYGTVGEAPNGARMRVVLRHVKRLNDDFEGHGERFLASWRRILDRTTAQGETDVR